MVRDIERKLALPNAQITAVSNSKDALARLQSRVLPPVDIAFLDENLEPCGLSGTELTRIIREEEIAVQAEIGARQRRMIIVGCTGNEGLEYNVMALEVGQDLVLGKPRSKGWESLLRGMIVERFAHER
eukprot:2314527-Prymnesium_polylepis.1